MSKTLKKPTCKGPVNQFLEKVGLQLGEHSEKKELEEGLTMQLGVTTRRGNTHGGVWRSRGTEPFKLGKGGGGPTASIILKRGKSGHKRIT